MSNQLTLICLAYDQPFTRAFSVEIGRGTMIGVLRKFIKEEKSPEYDSFAADILQLWKVNIRYGDSEERQRFEPRDNEELSPLMKVGDVFQEDLPGGHIHIIVKVPYHNQPEPPNEHLERLETDNDIPEIIIQLQDSANFDRLNERHLYDNNVQAVRSLPFQEHLRRKRYIEGLELSCNLPQSLQDSHFEKIIPANANPLDRVTKNEFGHYSNVFNGAELLSMSNFTQDKESQVRALLLEFLSTIRTFGEWGFRSQFPFHLVVHAQGQKLCYTPQSDFHMRIRDFPHLLLVINSQENESDRYRMLLQAACFARLGSSLRASSSRGPIVIMAIYIDEDFKASRYLLHQPVATSTEVQYITKHFNLTHPGAAFEFIFQLYNFVSAAKAHNDDFWNPESELAFIKNLVARKNYEILTSKRKREAAENSSNCSYESSPGVTQDIFDNPSLQEDLMAAGYTLTQMMSDEFEPLTPLKPTMHEATSRSGVSVVLKIIRDSNERRLLEYLGGIKAPSNHTIPLLEAIDLSIGKPMIVLPWKSPLDEVLKFRDHPDGVASLCFQFIEGVAFLHQHNVAHRNLKPGNVVVDIYDRPASSPRLFIIDFDLAKSVESEETMTEGWCGTPPWIAPELGSRDGPLQRYSPILADRWACGRMIQYFSNYITTHDEDKQNLLVFAQRLLSDNPRARPSLQAISGTKKRRSAGNQDEPAPKRPAVNLCS